MENQFQLMIHACDKPTVMYVSDEFEVVIRLILRFGDCPPSRLILLVETFQKKIQIQLSGLLVVNSWFSQPRIGCFRKLHCVLDSMRLRIARVYKVRAT